MPLSKFEPLLLSERISRRAYLRDRFAPCLYHRKYSSISRFDRPPRWTPSSSSPCRCSRRYNQLIWTPDSTRTGCTCPSLCVCKTICRPKGSSNPTVHKDLCSCIGTCLCKTLNCVCLHNPCFCCPSDKKASSLSKYDKLCDCWRRLVGCCSCPAREILYNCKPTRTISTYACSCSGLCLCAGALKKPCCCLWCRRCKCLHDVWKAKALNKYLQETSWLDLPIPPLHSRKPGYCTICLCECDCSCSLQVSEIPKSNKQRSRSKLGPLCVCCTCKPLPKSAIHLGDICVCPSSCDCTCKSMAEASEKCPSCTFPRTTSAKISSSSETKGPDSRLSKERRAKKSDSSIEDDFACPPWCTCKSKHRQMRRGSPKGNDFLSGCKLSDDSDCDLFRDAGGKVELDLDSDSDDSFRTCAWLYKTPPLDLDDTDSDALSIIDSDDDMVRTSDSESEFEFDFDFSPSSPRRSTKLRDVKFVCNRPTINVKLGKSF